MSLETIIDKLKESDDVKILNLDKQFIMQQAEMFDKSFKKKGISFEDVVDELDAFIESDTYRKQMVRGVSDLVEDAEGYVDEYLDFLRGIKTVAALSEGTVSSIADVVNLLDDSGQLISDNLIDDKSGPEVSDESLETLKDITGILSKILGVLDDSKEISSEQYEAVRENSRISKIGESLKFDSLRNVASKINPVNLVDNAGMAGMNALGIIGKVLGSAALVAILGPIVIDFVQGFIEGIFNFEEGKPFWDQVVDRAIPAIGDAIVASLDSLGGFIERQLPESLQTHMDGFPDALTGGLGLLATVTLPGIVLGALRLGVGAVGTLLTGSMTTAALGKSMLVTMGVFTMKRLLLGSLVGVGIFAATALAAWITDKNEQIVNEALDKANVEFENARSGKEFIDTAKNVDMLELERLGEVAQSPAERSELVDLGVSVAEGANRFINENIQSALDGNDELKNSTLADARLAIDTTFKTLNSLIKRGIEGPEIDALRDVYKDLLLSTQRLADSREGPDRLVIADQINNLPSVGIDLDEHLPELSSTFDQPVNRTKPVMPLIDDVMDGKYIPFLLPRERGLGDDNMQDIRDYLNKVEMESVNLRTFPDKSVESSITAVAVSPSSIYNDNRQTVMNTEINKFNGSGGDSAVEGYLPFNTRA